MTAARRAAAQPQQQQRLPPCLHGAGREWQALAILLQIVYRDGDMEEKRLFIGTETRKKTGFSVHEQLDEAGGGAEAAAAGGVAAAGCGGVAAAGARAPLPGAAAAEPAHDVMQRLGARSRTGSAAETRFAFDDSSRYVPRKQHADSTLVMQHDHDKMHQHQHRFAHLFMRVEDSNHMTKGSPLKQHVTLPAAGASPRCHSMLVKNFAADEA